MTIKLIPEYKIWGLEVNINKNEYLCVREQQKDLVMEDRTTIKHCHEYKYLSSNSSNEGALDKAIKERNTLGRNII